ncbi:MAG: acetylornithine transaminase [bacterium]
MTVNALMNTYGERTLTLDHGEGVWVWDDQGNKYLDALAGIAVSGIGHAHPKLLSAIAEQAGKLIHCSNLYNIPAQQKLGEKLIELSGMTNVFFGNSGAEANEAAIKIARLHGSTKKIDIPTIIVMENSFHGRTLATLTATGNRKVQAGFEPLVRGFSRAPYNDIDAVETIVENNDSVVAVMVEPIQGEGGINVPDGDYLKKLRQLCDNHDLLLILDEIQTGSGRTGKFLNYQHHDILPDVVTLAKGIANGFPIGACLASGKAAKLMTPGKHGSTFGGNPLACAAALATVEVILDEHLMDNASAMGRYFQERLQATVGDLNNVIEIRGEGLMVGIEMNEDCPDFVAKAATKGALINVTAGNVIRLLPPLTINREEIDQLVSILAALIQETA